MQGWLFKAPDMADTSDMKRTVIDIKKKNQLFRIQSKNVNNKKQNKKSSFLLYLFV